jgi:hypothetical protein
MAVRLSTSLFLATLPVLLNGCAAPVGVAVASYAADGVLLLTTEKTGTDHLLSISAGQDCAMWRVVRGRKICSDFKPGEENPYSVDYNAPHREVGEGGMVTVYTAARQGGRMMTEQEAKLALGGTSVAAADAPKRVAAAPERAQASRGLKIADLLPGSRDTATTGRQASRKASASRKTAAQPVVQAAARKPSGPAVRKPSTLTARRSPAVAPVPLPEQMAASTLTAEAVKGSASY